MLLGWEVGAEFWAHSRAASGTRTPGCLTRGHLLGRTDGRRRAISAPQAQGAPLGKEKACRGQDGELEREGRAGGRGSQKGDTALETTCFPLSGPWTAWPAGQAFRITSHNLIMTLLQPLGVNKAFPSRGGPCFGCTLSPAWPGLPLRWLPLCSWVPWRHAVGRLQHHFLLTFTFSRVSWPSAALPVKSSP